ncbi:MAG: hypothetical protein LUC24_05565 [Bacteroidales bacterium]|nr:hypothetical protein [Bacteroidales bacterium]
MASVFLMLLALAGCSGKADGGYRTQLTDDEMEKGEANFAVAEHLYIDAEVTPLEKYSDGLNSYYMEQVMDSGDKSSPETFTDEMTLFGWNQEELWQWLEDRLGASLSRDGLECSGGIYAMITGALEGNYVMDLTEAWTRQNGEAGDADEQTAAYYPTLYLDSEDEGTANAGACAGSIMTYLMESSDDLGFCDRDETAEELSDMLEELTGRKICGTWDCVTVTSEAAETAEEHSGIEVLGDGDEISDCYQYYFYYDIDGLSFEAMELDRELGDGEEYSDDVQLMDGWMIALQEWPLEVLYGEGGIAQAQAISSRVPGDVYRKAQEIISPSEVLGAVADYYSTKLLTDDVTITQLRLVYSSSFTDEGDGTTRNAICPFWKAVAYDAEKGYNVTFVYDAVTGEAMKEAEVLT